MGMMVINESLASISRAIGILSFGNLTIFPVLTWEKTFPGAFPGNWWKPGKSGNFLTGLPFLGT